MPLSGNRLGPKTAVTYTSDSTLVYNMKIDADLIISNAGLAAGNTGVTKPLGFRPRGVHAQFLDAGKIYRKFFICGTPAAALFTSNVPQDVTCDTAVFTTTGRKGETQRFI